MCPAVDIAFSLSHLWVVAPHVLCVCELLVAIIQRRDFKNIDAVNTNSEHPRQMGAFMSDTIVGSVYMALGLSAVYVWVVLLCVLTPGLLGLVLDKALLLRSVGRFYIFECSKSA